MAADAPAQPEPARTPPADRAGPSVPSSPPAPAPAPASQHRAGTSAKRGITVEIKAGTLSAIEARTTLDTKRAELLACARAAKTRGPLRLYMIVAPDGQIIAVNAASDGDPGAAEACACVRDKTHSLRFPPFSGARFSSIALDLAG
jgi:hypothetical protein